MLLLSINSCPISLRHKHMVQILRIGRKLLYEFHPGTIIVISTEPGKLVTIFV
jgi:hypothetical protein